MPARRVLALAVTLVIVVVACKRAGGDDTSSSSGGVDAGGFDKSALLRAFGQCASDTFGEFAAAAAALDASAKRAESEGTPAARDGARDAWKKAMDVWQRAEQFGFGPTAMSSMPGGQELRDPIYSWPLVSRCLIEQQLVDKTYERPEIATALITTRGLGATEYLLFYDGTDNACLPTDSINKNGTWAALGGAEIGKRKLAYARVLSADVAVRAQTLAALWDPARGNFVAALANAGPGKVFTSQQAAFNSVSNAFFYIDDFTKSMKVGKPTGLVPGCAAPPCLTDVESPWAKRSKDHLRSNLDGFDRLLRGCGPDGSGLGWDDLLVAVGDEALVKKLTAALAAARAALDALKEPSFEEDLQKNPAGVKAFFDALRGIVPLLKTEFISVLDLELPKRVEGDND